jgi:hypothetical protein
MRVFGWVGVAGFCFLGGCGDSGESKTKHVGDPCTPSYESRPTFSGWRLEEMNVEGAHPACGAGVCLVNHFQGRVSCPYGQSELEALEEPRCFTPGSSEPVTVPVEPQVTNRRPDLAVTCSCRCDGPDGGPFCNCPSGTECLPLVPDFGFPDGKAVVGSYCVDPASAYTGFSSGVCDPFIENCGTP